jgi:hypothetical protein
MSKQEQCGMRNRWRWAPLLLALVAAVRLVSPVMAQNNPLGQKPSSPFQEKSATAVPRASDPTTPEWLIGRLEVWAKRREAKQAPPIERETYYRFWEPRDRVEFEALGRYALLILTIVTQDTRELPLKRVYLRMPDREIPLIKLSSWRRDVDQTLVTYKMYGPCREDGFYLFPLSAYFRVAQVQGILQRTDPAYRCLNFLICMDPTG